MDRTVQLTDSEWLVMGALWELGPCTLPALTEALSDTGWSPNAVISFIKRLEQKGAAAVTGERRSKLYSAVIDRDSAVMEETGSLIDRVFGGDIQLLVQTAVRSRGLTRADAQELIRLLEEGMEQ